MIKIKIYKQIIRPSLTYAAPIWHNTKPTNQNTLERLQHRIIRNATNAPCYFRNKQILIETKIPTIAEYTDQITEKFNDTLQKHMNPTIHKLTRTSQS